LIWRQFRDFTGHYVAHCHNLAHEDHAMMFGWEITSPLPGVPTANAGGPYLVPSGGKITLSGSASGTTPITYIWNASAGSFDNYQSPTPVYTAPAFAAGTIINLSLLATNSAGSNTASAVLTLTDIVTISSSAYGVSKKTLTMKAISSSTSAVLKLMPYLTTGASIYDPSLLGNTFKLSKGVWSLTLSGVPQPAAGTLLTAGLQVKSSLGGVSPKTALGSVTR
jgi:hypothetical protein